MQILRLPSYTVAQIIVAYQRYLSPLKGFSCAHRAFHGGDSCSEWSRKAVLRAGLIRFPALLFRRLRACRIAYNMLTRAQSDEPRRDDDEEDDGRPEPCPAFNANSISCCVGVVPCSWPFS